MFGLQDDVKKSIENSSIDGKNLILPSNAKLAELYIHPNRQ
jgi:hypothetical protein